MNSVAMAVENGRGYEVLLSIYQLLKQAGDSDPAGHNSEIQDCLEFCRGLSLKHDQDSKEQMVDWVMWLVQKLPPTMQDLSFVDDKDVTSELAQNALEIDEDEFQRRQKEEEEGWAAMRRTVYNDTSPRMQKIRLRNEIISKLDLLDKIPLSPELKSACEKVDESLRSNAVNIEIFQSLLQMVDQTLATAQKEAQVSKTPDLNPLITQPDIGDHLATGTQEMAASGHWYHPKHQHHRR